MLNPIVLVSLLYLASIVKSNDVHLGYISPQSRKIYSEMKQADPALWKRTDEIAVAADGNEVITAVIITDLRDDKDGEAYIESGSIGAKSITIGLKSPSILRGYHFNVEVYAGDPNQRYYSKGGVSQQYMDETQFPRKY